MLNLITDINAIRWAEGAVFYILQINTKAFQFGRALMEYGVLNVSMKDLPEQ